ncbi:MAG: 30S ribosomal protein S6 [Candidatus Hodgkinia cicadicola]
MMARARIYELVMLLEPDATDASAQAVSTRLRNLLNAFGAKNVNYTCWNKISLAYKLHGFSFAFGLHFSFDLVNTTCAAKIENNVRRQFKPLRVCLFLSNDVSAKIEPSFVTNTDNLLVGS